nr:UvrD-like helicase, ATP-binding domain, P-loop containing nucleoside triphosphate hydrolase [Tanacetum cinerariifolium]
MLVFRSLDGKKKFKSFKIIYQGKTFWVRAKEVPGWSPEFEEQLDEDSEPEDDIFGGVDKPNTDNREEEFEDENVVPDMVFDDGSVKPSVVENSSGCNMDKQELNCDNLNGGASNQGDHVNVGIDNSYSKREGTESVGSGRFKKGDALRTGGSVLTVMDEFIKLPSAATNFRCRKQGRHEESPSKRELKRSGRVKCKGPVIEENTVDDAYSVEE